MTDPAKAIYLDNHATTRVDPRVVEAMLPFFTEHYGNPSGAGHSFGRQAARAVEHAKGQVAELIGAEACEIVFTSGATEANNLAIKGVISGLKHRGDHLVSAPTEHQSVLDPLRRLSRGGFRLGWAKVDAFGFVSTEAVEAAIEDRTVFASIMVANNEIGTVNDVAGIGRLCRSRSIVFHADATQAVGKIPFDVRCIGADLVSLSAHKLHGPKGVGALWIRRGDVAPRMSPLFDGGGQERGLRSGTLAVPLIVGFGEAARIARLEMNHEAKRLRALRDRLHSGLLESGLEFRLNGGPINGLPGNLNVSFPGIDGDALHARLSRAGVAVSAGAACHSGNAAASHVLLALGLDEGLARATLRFGLGRFTTEMEVDEGLRILVETCRQLRKSERAIDRRQCHSPSTV